MPTAPFPHASVQSMRRFLRCGLVLAALIVSTSVQAAIPSTERQALLDLYNGTQGTSAFGTGWVNSDGWGGAAGTECTWANVFCDDAQEHVVSISLDLYNLVGSLPASLNQLTQMTSFSVVENFLSGPVPALSGMTNLQSFSVGRNQLTGNIPSLSGLASLQNVFFGFNQLSGPIPSLAGLTNFNWFDAVDNQLTGSIPSLAGLTNLQAFLVTNNQLTGSLPDISDQTGLEIDADNNLLSGNLPASTQLAHLSALFVESNQFSGRIPELAGITSLTNFDVARNQLSGPMPALSGMTNLQNIYFASNQLSGAIPALTGLTGLSNLRTFVADHNQLSGSLPELTGLSNLSSIYLDHNQLTGHIPPLTDLTFLMTLTLDHNQLSGSIPSLGGLPWLGTFNVNDNRLHGAAPALPSPTTLEPYGSGALCPNYLDKVVSTDWDSITQLTPWYQACSAQPAQALTLSPQSFVVTAPAGGNVTTTLTIGNAGTANLHWSLAAAGSDCATPGNVDWILSVPPSSGTTVADAGSPVALMFNAGALARGAYSASICVTSDDPAQPVVGIPVNFTVEESVDTIFTGNFDGITP